MVQLNISLGGISASVLRGVVWTLLAVIASAFGWGCGTNSPYYRHSEDRLPGEHRNPIPTAQDRYTLFFIGDAGEPSRNPLEPILQSLQYQLERADEQSVVVFLGDNIYAKGLRPKDHPLRLESERRINGQLGILEQYAGRAVFIPGNHDWRGDEPGGLDAVRRQGHYVRSKLRDSTAFLPEPGCPGPVEVPLTDAIHLLILDTQWWLYPHEKGGTASCAHGSKDLFIRAVDSLVEANQNRALFIAGHHPLHSNGTHAGYYPAKVHLFPLLDISPVLYIPLPVIGSIKPLYKKYIGFRQDLAGRDYSELRRLLEASFDKHPQLVYVSGHDHNLQYHPIGNLHYVVSGSGAYTGYARRGKSADFVYSHNGFARMDVMDAEVVLSFWVPGKDHPAGRCVFKSTLFEMK